MSVNVLGVHRHPEGEEEEGGAERERERTLSETELQRTLEAHVATLIALALGSGACVFFRLVIIKLIGG